MSHKIIDIYNFHSQIEKFCSEYSIDICDDKILTKMAENGYFVSSISPMKVKRGLAECRIRATNGKHEESISIINSCLIPCPHCEKKEEEEEEELAGMKSPEIKKLCMNLLIEKYKNEKKKETTAGTKGKKEKSAEKCKGNVCFTCEKQPASPMKEGKNNAFKRCSKNAVENGLCVKCNTEKECSKFGELRNGEYGKPHPFSEVLKKKTVKNKFEEWVNFIWETYPEMKPAE